MSAPKSQLANGLVRIWQRHQQLVHQRAAFIANAVILLKLNQLTPDLRQQAGEDAHKLAGNLGTFGHPTGSEHARAIELALLSEGQFDSKEFQQLEIHLNQLQTAIHETATAIGKIASTTKVATIVDRGVVK